MISDRSRALHLLDVAKEHSNHRIAFETRRRALLEKHVRFVDEDDRSPFTSQVEHRLVLAIQIVGGSA